MKTDPVTHLSLSRASQRDISSYSKTTRDD